jgi:hypothetical protein
VSTRFGRFRKGKDADAAIRPMLEGKIRVAEEPAK